MCTLLLPLNSIAGGAICILTLLTVVGRAATSTNLRPQQVARALEDNSGNERKQLYPDYSWFNGLENRILLEYPKLRQLAGKHHEALRQEHNYGQAVKLHKQLFMEIYLAELAKLSAPEGASPSERMGWKAARESGGLANEHLAAYKVFDLWANTPGDFVSEAGSYSNYLEPYLVQSHIEFWSYCLDERDGCREVLNQLAVLARSHELGPVELLQVSLNIIMLMNSHKADLLLERLVNRKVIELSQEGASGSQQHGDEQAQEAAAYEHLLEMLVALMEIDEQFNEAAFNYVFTNTEAVHRIVDSPLELYLAQRIEEFKREQASDA